MHLVIQPPTIEEDEMYTVVADVMPPTVNSWVPITGLQRLPDGEVVDTVRCAAGDWVLLVWRPPQGDRYATDFAYGVRVSGVDIATRSSQPVGGAVSPRAAIEFTLTTDADVQIVGNNVTSAQYRTIIAGRGDVFALAPIVT